MYRVDFEYREDEEFGSMGWIPKAYPMFNAATGFGLVHDVLEHFPGDDPDLVGEMKAFGSMINIRWMGGWQQYKGYSRYTPEQNMASDIRVFLRDINHGNDDRTFYAPPRTYKIKDDAVEELIDGALREGVKMYKAELEYEDEEFMSERALNAIVEKMRGWMRIGYRQSVRRFHHASQLDLADLFSRIEQEVTHLPSGDYGDVLSISVSPKNLDYRVRISTPRYEY